MDIALSQRQRCDGNKHISRTPDHAEISDSNLQGCNSPKSGLGDKPHTLADVEPLMDTAQRTSDLKIKTALKTLKLNAVYSLYLGMRGVRLQEEPKVALHTHRGYAFLGGMIHFIPVGASLALASINIRGIYVGDQLAGPLGQDSQKFAGLQFAAKLHELVILSSLTAIVLTYIRKIMLYGDGLPFGALFAGQQFRDLSFLWSAEFWATIRQRERRDRSRFNSFIALLIISTLLSVSVGPSTAQLMRPRLDDWPAGGTTFWLNATNDTIFPTVLNSSEKWEHCLFDTGDFSCPHGGWQMINNGFCPSLATLTAGGTLPDLLVVHGMRTPRSMWPKIRRGTSRTKWPLYPNSYTRATVPMSSIADSTSEIGRFWAFAAAHVQKNKRFMARRDAKFSIDAPQPAVATKCHLQNVSDEAVPVQFLWFPNLTSVEYTDRNDNAISGFAKFTNVAFRDERKISTILNLLKLRTEPDILWYKPAEDMGSTLHAVAIFPDAALTNISQFYSCSFDSRYFPATTSTKRKDVKFSFFENGDDYWLRGVLNSDYPQIFMSPDWAQYLNPITQNEGSTAFAQMTKTAGMWNTSITPDQGFVQEIVEVILTTMALNGIARADYGISIAGRAKGTNSSTPELGPSSYPFLNELLPRKYLGDGGKAYEITDEEMRAATPFKARVFATGYAYTYRGAAQIAAVSVLILYSMLAIGHFCYMLRTGEQSNAWDTTPELVALAINSTPTQRLKNTGAGIDTNNVFKEIVKVQVKDGDCLEFVFSDTEDTADVTNAFHKNQYYA